MYVVDTVCGRDEDNENKLIMDIVCSWDELPAIAWIIYDNFMAAK